MPLGHYWSSFLLSRIFTQDCLRKMFVSKLEYQEEDHLLKNFYEFLDMFNICWCYGPCFVSPKYICWSPNLQCNCAVVSDSVRPHGLHPTRLLHPWDSPGKNTRVGCHFLLQCMKGESESEVVQSCLTLSNPMDCSLPGSSSHGIFRATVLEWDAIAFSPNVTVVGGNEG